MRRIPPRIRNVSDVLLQELSKRGEMTLTEAAEALGCQSAQVADSLQKLVSSTRDPCRYFITLSGTWTGQARTPLRTAQVSVESTQETRLRRKMIRLPEFQQVARLPLPPAWFKLGEAARALKMPRRKTLQRLGLYGRMGYLTAHRVVSRRGTREIFWQRVW
jgi:hypothetical protein